MKTLELRFSNEDERVVTLSIDNPNEPIDPDAVRQVMEEIIETNAVFSTGGDLASIHSARIVERLVEDIVW
ncbi:DUF2922 domain-containing protein [Amphibacillus sp. MSJ-3]|uniref:DUF2922 domain-containing protein n=1 Tax=Amphibacillus sp. MSJ-3 TaxID=2841505 RepID=UPI001C0EC3F0|nr:DUF2922 domain-containing protein [Amphibacillus sp. MSJ-3]MBU5595460.1 DUF2922 domain-containing protein [Amphibacillus sp. MSJ-3]